MPNGFFVCAVGNGASKKTILTAEKRTFYTLPGGIIEGGMQDALRSWLICGSLSGLAMVDENRFTHMRQALALTDGRTKAAETERLATVADEVPTNQVKFVGAGRSAMLIVTRRATAWAVVPSTRLIYESKLHQGLKQWLEQSDVFDAASELNVSVNRIITARKYFGVQRKR